ncbi:hypothetical protein N7462_011701 [Penicillium macrosclerotiorum]|uniref:uncharacterized protein n=1 Tax=Penicillium macrosclerotiorum TaxID=303699 RepID=UPI002546D635|nr:uncharacterized protein N7462_011701 [Penicillium macrosclerotiorum]KAJ5662775.1 hypothetical protein N7462_011701 [Penicillium macrosclerotiorum]
MADPAPQKALIVGISGPSSSGKTTLARLLQRIFSGVRLDAATATISTKNPNTKPETLNTFIIHEDDFYYPDDQIPWTTTPSGKTVQDWDTAAAIDTGFLAQALSYVRAHGRLPPRLQSKEDQNEDSGSGVADAVVQELRAQVAAQLAGAQGRPDTLAFMEGFLLYGPQEGGNSDGEALRRVQGQIGLPLFLPAGYSTVKARREGRSGYVTIGPAPGPEAGVDVEGGRPHGENDREIDLEGEDDRPPQNFWTDPPGYVDDIVWPRYVRDHAWLLVADEGKEGDLVARVGEGLEVRADAGVKVAPGKGAAGMEFVLKWAVEEVLRFYLEAR